MGHFREIRAAERRQANQKHTVLNKVVNSHAMGCFCRKKPIQGWCVEWCADSRSYFWTSCKTKNEAITGASYILTKTSKNTVVLGRRQWNLCFEVEERILSPGRPNLLPGILEEYGPPTHYLVAKWMCTMFTLKMPTNSVRKSIQKMSSNKMPYLFRKSDFSKSGFNS